ncbi:MAG: ABC transporter ATP-binding protein [Campylobacterales bacterium]|nr:ABC transporter ATP-binding protein [Campylobacterales bacterium]
MIACNKIYIKHKKSVLVDIGFDIKSATALVGQSGSGKSLTLKALLGLLPRSLDSELDIKSDFELIRGKSIGFVPQNAFTALSPMSIIKKQWIGDMKNAYELFEMTGLDSGLLERFPSELSGGQLQRVIISIALAPKPKLLLLDEPTTALDPNLREEIIKILIQLQQKIGFLMLFVTHDMSIAKKLCDDIVVLKNGKCIEGGNAKRIFEQPKEPYTKELIDSSFENREFRK